eukprot:scaffold8644_cov44-Phaeocystis_antarctica.AAC.2
MQPPLRPNTPTVACAYGGAPDRFPLDEIPRVERAEPHGLDPTHDHDDEVPVRRHGLMWAAWHTPRLCCRPNAARRGGRLVEIGLPQMAGC